MPLRPQYHAHAPVQTILNGMDYGVIRVGRLTNPDYALQNVTIVMADKEEEKWNPVSHVTW